MRYLILSFVIFIAFNPKNTLAQKVNWEFNAGGDLGTLVNSSNKFPARLGYYFGIKKTFYLSDKFSINPSLSFSLRRFRTMSTLQYTGPDVGIPNYLDTVSSNNSITSGYLNLPIALQYEISKKLSLSVGSEFSMKLFEKDQIDRSIRGNGGLFRPFEKLNSAAYLSDGGVDFLEINAMAGLEYKLGNKIAVNIYANYEIASPYSLKGYAALYTRPYEGTHELWIQLGGGYLINRINK